MPLNLTNDTSAIEAILASFDFDKPELYEWTDNEATEIVKELTVVGTDVDPVKVDEINMGHFRRARKNPIFGVKEDLPTTRAVLKKGDIPDENIIKTGITQDHIKAMLRRSVFFAFLHGNVTANKYWFLVGKLGNKKLYAAFPDLDVNDRRSVLVHCYRNEISSLLQKGYKNTLMTILERSNVSVHEDKKKFLFPKGHLLDDCPKDDINQVRMELGSIFVQMKEKDISQRKFVIPWFQKGFASGTTGASA